MLIRICWHRTISTHNKSAFSMPVATMAHTSSATQPQSIDLSLVRITELLHRLSVPQTKYPVIHVAGTNSKGSTIAYLSSILNNYIGIPTASFTSPHLRIERDCCKVGSQIVDEAIWEEAGNRIQEADAATIQSSSSSSSALPLNNTLFERLTARCFVAFDLLPPSKRPEILLIEVGMGGAKDATNVFSPGQVLASVICPIDYDHQSFLGNTLADIAQQKAGIVKQGGLCIMADQRRQGIDADDQVECTKIRAADAQSCVDGREVAEIQESIRQACSTLQARLVKAYVPWGALVLETSTNEQLNLQSPWSLQVQSHARYTSVLLESNSRPGDYISSTGDPVVPGPTLRLPRTRAALTGCHLALQTLWSIARDETPCALGKAGSDINEELRLRIAFALRDDRFAQQDLSTCIEQTRIPGRAEWTDVKLLNEQISSVQVDGGDTDMEAQPSLTLTSSNLHTLIDGAHNSSAASALRTYVDSCLQHRMILSKQQEQPISHVTIIWIIAFSQGKDITDIVEKLFGQGIPAEQSVDNMTSHLAASVLDTHIEHKVACLPFTTPVEGMPWVSSVPADQVAGVMATHARSVIEVKTFEVLKQALSWAASHGDGKSVIEGKTNMVVIAGSLYLVSDVHRLLLSL